MPDDEIENNASKTARFFFACMSVSIVILAVRVPIVLEVNIISVKAIWNTFLFLFGIMPVFGIVAMALWIIGHELKYYVQNKRDKMFNFFDNIGDKISVHGIIGYGMIGGLISTMLLFKPTWDGIIDSAMTLTGTFILLMAGAAFKKYAEKFGEDAYDWSKKKTLKYSKNGKEKASKPKTEKRA